MGGSKKKIEKSMLSKRLQILQNLSDAVPRPQRGCTRWNMPHKGKLGRHGSPAFRFSEFFKNIVLVAEAELVHFVGRIPCTQGTVRYSTFESQLGVNQDEERTSEGKLFVRVKEDKKVTGRREQVSGAAEKRLSFPETLDSSRHYHIPVRCAVLCCAVLCCASSLIRGGQTSLV